MSPRVGKGGKRGERLRGPRLRAVWFEGYRPSALHPSWVLPLKPSPGPSSALPCASGSCLPGSPGVQVSWLGWPLGGTDKGWEVGGRQEPGCPPLCVPPLAFLQAAVLHSSPSSWGTGCPVLVAHLGLESPHFLPDPSGLGVVELSCMANVWVAHCPPFAISVL